LAGLLSTRKCTVRGSTNSRTRKRGEVKAIILAGGKGTRLAPYSTILPKPLMPIGDQPILEILLRQMKRAGVEEAILTVGHLAGLLRAYFQDGQQLGMRLSYSYEQEPLGTAGPLSLIPGLEETFLVTNGDVLTTLDIGGLIDFHRRSGAVATIAMHHREIRIDLGVIVLNGSNEVKGYVEKPTYGFDVSMGIYVFEPRVLNHIPHNKYLDFPDLVLRLLEQGERVVGFPFTGYWQDLGRPDDYAQAVAEFESLKPQILGEY
jgi:NDP-sugar pyrophosphorylase family protein